ncbi:translation initiation factor IF-2-like [Pipra filicauda]|uniref:Translation initiation factor IF-2-like n=1 Tax=Pipra filicauda TaxID=649802 RepID=A0A7R5L3X4_9PASS|nr:translation initiation factor IF-2-like [Pipra filicauda]
MMLLGSSWNLLPAPSSILGHGQGWDPPRHTRSPEGQAGQAPSAAPPQARGHPGRIPEPSAHPSQARGHPARIPEPSQHPQFIHPRHRDTQRGSQNPQLIHPRHRDTQGGSQNPQLIHPRHRDIQGGSQNPQLIHPRHGDTQRGSQNPPSTLGSSIPRPPAHSWPFPRLHTLHTRTHHPPMARDPHPSPRGTDWEQLGPAPGTLCSRDRDTASQCPTPLQGQAQLPAGSMARAGRGDTAQRPGGSPAAPPHPHTCTGLGFPSARTCPRRLPTQDKGAERGRGTERRRMDGQSASPGRREVEAGDGGRRWRLPTSIHPSPRGGEGGRGTTSHCGSRAASIPQLHVT